LSFKIRQTELNFVLIFALNLIFKKNCVAAKLQQHTEKEKKNLNYILALQNVNNFRSLSFRLEKKQKIKD